jgi:hypothetical protein
VNPFALAALAWQASTVITLRTLTLWTQPAQAQLLLAQYALEKHRAFQAGSVAAQRAARAGADPGKVMAAALRPAERRLRQNYRQIGTGG